ncbi:hypothetical protein BC827DRAFT_1240052 [Russula dissimulans]|nr:hypothetical protein BC827DRAFT_1240052 [Russula dissimulans]
MNHWASETPLVICGLGSCTAGAAVIKGTYKPDPTCKTPHVRQLYSAACCSQCNPHQWKIHEPWQYCVSSVRSRLSVTQ